MHSTNASIVGIKVMSAIHITNVCSELNLYSSNLTCQLIAKGASTACRYRRCTNQFSPCKTTLLSVRTHGCRLSVRIHGIWSSV